ncbi:hypothetical protein [Streptomyces sp. NPDC052114]|uniref:hypothetical protein n=1 Tax=unclassified Streptomyces TaxID=2593676 RepID=UPI003437E887
MSSQSAAELRSRYVEQVASELEENRRRQEELAKSIEVLKQEETLLTDILGLAERYEDLAIAQRLPEQKQDEPVVAKAKNGAKGKPKSDGKGDPRRPLLGDLLMTLLDGHDEPRSAKELREELLKKHPHREPTPQVVRNTLESLVAKARIERHKQQRSVMYTVVGSADAG